MNKNWIYYGVFFPDKTKVTILNYVKQSLSKMGISIPENWKIYCDHVTIVYNDKSEGRQKTAEELEPFIGEHVGIRTTSIGVSDRAIALGVNYVTQNEHSHVTVAIAPNAKPVESNYITKWYPTDGSFYITGVINKISK